MEEVDLKITLEIFTEGREAVFDPITWDMDSLVITNVGQYGIPFTTNEITILQESLYQIKPKSENYWHEIVLERKVLNNGLEAPPDEWYELITIKEIQ